MRLLALLLPGCALLPGDPPDRPAVSQVGRYAAGVGHVSVRSLAIPSCDELGPSVTVETRGSDGVWEYATDVAVDCDGPQDLDVVLVADNSGSVSEWQGVISDALTRYGSQLLADPESRAGLVRVSTQASVLAPLAADPVAWQAGVEALQPDDGWTALWDGVRLAHEAHGAAEQVRTSADLQACVNEAHRAVVAYTDGRDNNSADEHDGYYPDDGVDTRFEDLLSLQVAGIQPPVYTIGVGEGIDVQALADLASGTGGEFLPIEDHEGLADALSAADDTLSAEIPVCWETPDCADTEVRLTVTYGDQAWVQTFTLPDDLCVNAEDGGCTLTVGYWKNHPEAWSTDTLTVGGRSYPRDTLVGLLTTPAGGDRSLQLGQQLVAARLNEARGADVTSLGSTLADADAWLAAHDDGDGLPFGTRAWEGGDTLHTALDDYNNGRTGPGHCD